MTTGESRVPNPVDDMNASRPAVPRKWLLGPAIGVAVVAAVLLVLGILIPNGLVLHGGLAPVLFLVFAVAFIIGSVVELFALAIAVTAMVRAPELRTAANVAAVALGLGLFVALGWFTYRM